MSRYKKLVGKERKRAEGAGRPEGIKTPLPNRGAREFASVNRLTALLAAVMREQLRRRGVPVSLPLAADMACVAMMERGKTPNPESVRKLLNDGRVSKEILHKAFALLDDKGTVPDDVRRAAAEGLAAMIAARRAEPN